eukprot:bmy_22308T0
MMPKLQKHSIHIKNSTKVEEIICDLVKGGGVILQLLTDFDMTLSKYKGKRCPTCHNITDNCKLVTDIQLKERYSLEVDLVLTEMKTSSKAKFKEFVEEFEDMFKEGYENLFDKLQQHNIPVFILLHCTETIIADGVADVKHIQKTEYLNERMGELLEKCMGSYDIVLVQFSTHWR